MVAGRVDAVHVLGAVDGDEQDLRRREGDERVGERWGWGCERGGEGGGVGCHFEYGGIGVGLGGIGVGLV